MNEKFNLYCDEFQQTAACSYSLGNKLKHLRLQKFYFKSMIDFVLISNLVDPQIEYTIDMHSPTTV